MLGFVAGAIPHCVEVLQEAQSHKLLSYNETVPRTPHPAFRLRMATARQNGPLSPLCGERAGKRAISILLVCSWQDV